MEEEIRNKKRLGEANREIRDSIDKGVVRRRKQRAQSSTIMDRVWRGKEDSKAHKTEN